MHPKQDYASQGSLPGQTSGCEASGLVLTYSLTDGSRVLGKALNPSAGWIGVHEEQQLFNIFVGEGKFILRIWRGCLLRDGSDRHSAGCAHQCDQQTHTLPRFIYEPYYVVPKSYEGLENTDPFVFGEQFHCTGGSGGLRAPAPSVDESVVRYAQH